MHFYLAACHQCRKLDTAAFHLNDLDLGACIVFIVRTPYLRISNFVSHYEPTYDKNCGNGSLSVILFWPNAIVYLATVITCNVRF